MKKIISVFLSLVIIFALSGCGKGATVESVNAKLYFLDENMEYAVEMREIKSANKWKETTKELLEGPKSENLTSAIKGDVKVLGAEIVEGICVVDLSKEFEQHNTGGSYEESLAIYSVVNTLCALGADGVRIRIEGNEDVDFGGHFYLGDNFYFEPNMVRAEDR